MKKDILIPQGKFKVGRDIPEGVYLIASINELTFVKVDYENDNYENYTLDDYNTKLCHVELEKDNILTISGSVVIRHITKFNSEENSFNLFEEIEDFKTSIKNMEGVKKNAKTLKKREVIEEISDEFEKEESEKSLKSKQKIGFWKTFGMLFSSSESVSSSSNTNKGWFASHNKKHNGRCDGDCANCPPHYGYRYGRWYYGHNHIEGCVFGGNKGSGGKD